MNFAQKIQEILVPDKRTVKTTNINIGLATQVQNLHDGLINRYKAHSILALWTAGSYDRGDDVRYGKSIFQSNIDNNTDEPTYTSNWTLVSNNYLGTDFLLKIRGEKLILEYALNDWFSTTFRYKPQTSDIFLITNSIAQTGFRVGALSLESSSISGLGSSEPIKNINVASNQNNLTINFPLSVYNALGTTDSIRDSIVRSFADKYITGGITYNINTY